jgi:Zn-dependent protease/predicted transcriptional regulator
MFGRSFRIARVAGIPVNVDASWIWIAVLAVYTLYSRFEGRFDTSGSGAFVYAVLGALLFFGSVFLHELAHALIARLSKIRVDGITLVFFGGFTSARSDERGALPAFAIAAFGPATSFALAIVFWAGANAIEGASGPLPGLLRYLAAINLFMAVFNVLPGLPLDGGRMLQAAVWGITGDRAKGTRVASSGGLVLGIVLFGLAAYEVTKQNLFAAIWLALIGSFIFQGARTIRQQIGLGERLAAATVADAMEPAPPSVPGDLSLSETLDRFLRGHEEEAFPVVESGHVIGMISFDSARTLGAQDPLRPVRDAVIPLSEVLVAQADEPLNAVAARLGTGRAALVLRDGALVGAITGRGVSRYAARR